MRLLDDVLLSERQRALEGISFEHELAARSAQQVVVRILDARESVLIQSDESENGRRKAPRRPRSAPCLFLNDVYALQIERAHALRDVVRDFAFQPAKMGLLIERRDDLIRCVAENRGELGSRIVLIGDLGRIRVDAFRFERAHQYRARAIVDRTATRKDLDRLRTLVERFTRVKAPVQYLNVDQTPSQIQTDEGEEPERDLRAVR